MKAKFQGREYVLVPDNNLKRTTATMDHKGSMPGVRVSGWATTPQVYSDGEHLYAAAVVGASPFINYVALMRPVSEVEAELRALLA